MQASWPTRSRVSRAARASVEALGQATGALAARLTRDRVGQLACILADHDIDPSYAQRCSGY
ncbi:MAG: hypothetical protein QM608_15340, partial [Caulobacter sp.]